MLGDAQVCSCTAWCTLTGFTVPDAEPCTQFVKAELDHQSSAVKSDSRAPVESQRQRKDVVDMRNHDPLPFTIGRGDAWKDGAETTVTKKVTELLGYLHVALVDMIPDECSRARIAGSGCRFGIMFSQVRPFTILAIFLDLGKICYCSLGWCTDYEAYQDHKPGLQQHSYFDSIVGIGDHQVCSCCVSAIRRWSHCDESEGDNPAESHRAMHPAREHRHGLSTNACDVRVMATCISRWVAAS